jgi:hypothetical protein
MASPSTIHEPSRRSGSSSKLAVGRLCLMASVITANTGSEAGSGGGDGETCRGALEMSVALGVADAVDDDRRATEPGADDASSDAGDAQPVTASARVIATGIDVRLPIHVPYTTEWLCVPATSVPALATAGPPSRGISRPDRARRRAPG